MGTTPDQQPGRHDEVASPTGHVLIAPDKFKGSLTASEVARHVAAGLERVRPGVPVVTLPVADGGDGTAEAAVAAGFERVTVEVTGPAGNPVTASYAVRGGTAVIELAEASGLHRLPEGRPQPMTASSLGTGQLIAEAVRGGAKKIVLGLGGSASTDGGAGLIQGLGGRLLDAMGNQLPRWSRSPEPARTGSARDERPGRDRSDRGE